MEHSKIYWKTAVDPVMEEIVEEIQFIQTSQSIKICWMNIYQKIHIHMATWDGIDYEHWTKIIC